MSIKQLTYEDVFSFFKAGIDYQWAEEDNIMACSTMDIGTYLYAIYPIKGNEDHIELITPGMVKQTPFLTEGNYLIKYGALGYSAIKSHSLTITECLKTNKITSIQFESKKRFNQLEAIKKMIGFGLKIEL